MSTRLLSASHCSECQQRNFEITPAQARSRLLRGQLFQVKTCAGDEVAEPVDQQKLPALFGRGAASGFDRAVGYNPLFDLRFELGDTGQRSRTGLLDAISAYHALVGL